MTNEMYKDDFYQFFGPGEYDKLTAAQKKLEANTHWETGISTRDITFTHIDTPEEKPEFAGISSELLSDTMSNAGLVANYNGKHVCLRSCAMQSLQATVGISGPAIPRSTKANLAAGLNAFVCSARDKSQMMIRAGKISAVLSNSYQYMPISQLLEVCDRLAWTFGTADFVHGSVAHDLTTAEFEFPESAAQITKAYNNALVNAGRSGSGTLIPVVQLRAADTSKETAKLLTYLKLGEHKLMPIGGISVKHINPGARTSTQKAETCMDRFRNEASTLFSKMESDVSNLIPKMLEVAISHPGNCFIGLCSATRS